MPPPNAFPNNKISGTTLYCSKAHKDPVFQNRPVFHQKSIKLLVLLHFCNGIVIHSEDRLVTPLSACTVSTITQAVCIVNSLNYSIAIIIEMVNIWQ